MQTKDRNEKGESFLYYFLTWVYVIEALYYVLSFILEN